MAEKAQNKKTKKTKKTASSEIAEVVNVESPEVLETAIRDVLVDEQNINTIEDEVLNEIESQVQNKDLEEKKHTAENVDEELKSVEKNSIATREDPFSNENEFSFQQTLTAKNPNKKMNRRVMIAFDEWNGTYIM